MNASYTPWIIVGLIVVGIGGYLAGMNSKKAAVSSNDTMAGVTVVKTAAGPTTDAEKITNAMSAAPVDIAKGATVMDWPAKEGAAMSELRKGTNEWTCLPDDPTTPGNDPVCVDKMALQWFGAYMQHQTPKIAQAGIGYMLQGGATASNSDPYATTPKAGESWMEAPAHIMVFPATKLDTKVYGIEMKGGPWVMWAGTPYEHLMVPVM